MVTKPPVGKVGLPDAVSGFLAKKTVTIITFTNPSNFRFGKKGITYFPKTIKFGEYMCLSEHPYAPISICI